MAKIIGISGSLRRASFNAALLRAAVELAPAGTSIEIVMFESVEWMISIPASESA